jgi:hypothetical protein
VLRKLLDPFREFGAASGGFYILDRAMKRLGLAGGVYRYILVAQPVPERPLLGPRRGQSIAVRQVAAGDPALAAMPLTDRVLDYRYRQGAICFGAFQDETMIGCLWLCLGPYDEDEVRCRFVPLPPGQASWDFDVYVRSDLRTGLAFARLWDAANAYLRERGAAWSISRISGFNPRSLASHNRLGARRIGTATYVAIGQWQIMFASLPPRLHLSTGPGHIPELRLPAP